MSPLVKEAQSLATESAIALALAPTEEELDRRLGELIDERMRAAGLVGPFTHEERMTWMDEFTTRVLGEARGTKEEGV